MTTMHLTSMIVLPIMLLFSSLAKAIMDTLRFNYYGSIFRNMGSIWWNPAESWKNKWKNGNSTLGEAFPGSSTIFVSFTDGWHFFQHWFLLPLFFYPIAYSQCFPFIPWTYWYITDFLLFYAFFTFTFEMFYQLFKLK